MMHISDALAGKERREAIAHGDAEVMAMKRAVRMGIHRDALPAMAAKAREYTDKGMTVAESPIERIMLGPLVLGDWEGFLTFPVPVFLPTEDMPPLGDIVIVPQFRFGRYRADIAIICAERGGGRKIFFIECDGAAYHREWVSDRERDRYLDRLGATTIRLSGSDISNDPAGCVQRVLTVITGWKDAQQ